MLLALAAADPTIAFVPTGVGAADSRWTFTATDGSTGGPADPITLTWSFVPDGTQVQNLDTNAFQPSDLIADFDAEFGAGVGGSDLTLRPWFTYFEQSFDRIGALTGVTYVYEPNDTGATHGTSTTGSLGVRGDVRIGGIGMDGIGGTLAYNAFPNNGDMAIDTDDLTDLLGDPTNNFRGLRNTIMHEAGHGLGLEHTSSSNSGILMEPFINTSFDGPQHDDLRGFHWFYGDVFEKGGRNETAATATSLGVLSPDATLTIGTSGNGTIVGGAETDFVSISNEDDLDFFSFTIAEPLTVSLEMTPRGATFDQGGQQFVTTETSNLSVALFDTDGTTQLAIASSAGAGINESINSVELDGAGTYFARVRGPITTQEQVTQFYELAVIAEPEPPALPGDYNLDGFVNAADYTLWRDTELTSVANFSGADGDGNGFINAADYTVWASAYGGSLPPATAVPEPAGALLALVCTFTVGARKRRRIRLESVGPRR